MLSRISGNPRPAGVNSQASALDLVEALKSKDEGAVRRLLELRPALAEFNPSFTGVNWDLMHFAVASGCGGGMIEILAEAGVQVDQSGQDGYTPLLMAAKTGNAALISALFRAGADPNATSDEGSSALALAAASGKIEAVEAVLNTGAVDVKAPAPLGHTALTVAAVLGKTRVAEWLQRQYLARNLPLSDRETTILEERKIRLIADHTPSRIRVELERVGRLRQAVQAGDNHSVNRLFMHNAQRHGVEHAYNASSRQGRRIHTAPADPATTRHMPKSLRASLSGSIALLGCGSGEAERERPVHRQPGTVKLSCGGYSVAHGQISSGSKVRDFAPGCQGSFAQIAMVA